jgi:hypothetical protein
MSSSLPVHLARMFQQWLTDKKIPMNCPECRDDGPGSAEWFAAPTLNKKGEADKLTCVPMVALICGNCGNVRLFSAVKVGIFPGLHESQ